MTKLDVMSNIPEIKVATHYTLNGRKLEGQMPSTYEELVQCEVVTETLPGWTEDISNVKSFADLPENA